jgi:hypothetical protein
MTAGSLTTAGRTERAGRPLDRATRVTTNHNGANPVPRPASMTGGAGLPRSSNGSGRIVTLITPSTPAAASTATTTKRGRWRRPTAPAVAAATIVAKTEA